MFLQLVTHVGGRYGVRGVGGVECPSFSAAPARRHGKEEELQLLEPRSGPGESPPSRTAPAPGSAFRHRQFLSTKGPLLGFRERRTMQSLLYLLYLEELSSSIPRHPGGSRDLPLLSS